MKRTLKGFVGMLTVIALLALAGGYVHAGGDRRRCRHTFRTRLITL